MSDEKSQDERGREFWQEFVRVQFDKLCLLALIGVLAKFHAPDLWLGSVLGAYLILVQGQRFKFPSGKEKPPGATALPGIGGPPVDKQW